MSYTVKNVTNMMLGVHSSEGYSTYRPGQGVDSRSHPETASILSVEVCEILRDDYGRLCTKAHLDNLDLGPNALSMNDLVNKLEDIKKDYNLLVHSHIEHHAVPANPPGTTIYSTIPDLALNEVMQRVSKAVGNSQYPGMKTAEDLIAEPTGYSTRGVDTSCECGKEKHGFVAHSPWCGAK